VKDGRRFSRPPNPYTPPSDTGGSVNLSDPESPSTGFMSPPCRQRRGARARGPRCALFVLERGATAIPDVAAADVAAAMLEL
jgi:hypothetical protein